MLWKTRFILPFVEEKMREARLCKTRGVICHFCLEIGQMRYCDTEPRAGLNTRHWMYTSKKTIIFEQLITAIIIN